MYFDVILYSYIFICPFFGHKERAKETLGAELHSLNNSTVQLKRVNSVFVMINVKLNN